MDFICEYCSSTSGLYGIYIYIHTYIEQKHYAFGAYKIKNLLCYTYVWLSVLYTQLLPLNLL